MTWRSRTFFEFAILLVALVPLRAAEVSGTVQIRDSRNGQVAKRKDYSGAVISLRPVGLPVPAPPAKHAVIEQRNKTFTPHILPILAGTTVDFPNFDPVFHNAFSRFSGQIFDVGLYPPGTSRSVRFTRTGAVRIFCNIHADMTAVILVLGTSYFAVTNREGGFRLDVPAGSYDLAVFHERATEETLQRLSQRIAVGSEPLKLPGIVISEAGYLLAPHKNKYGLDYGPPPDDKTIYPGARN
jgi:plastocyanin